MKPKQLMEVALGIVTGIAGYLDAGTIVTSAAAGAAFGYKLLWIVLIGTVCIASLAEMSGRFAAVSHHTVTAALRERMGFNFFIIAGMSTVLITVLTLSAEVGGVAFAVHMVTGVSARALVVPVAVVIWALIWFGTFGFLENGVAMLGLVTIAFATALWKVGIQWHEVGHGLIPTLPHSNKVHYWFTAVGMLGALISPYLLFFYSSGGIEDKWTREYIGTNRAVAVVGMGFGSTISIAVLGLGAMILTPLGISDVTSYDQLTLTLTAVYGHTGFYLFAGSLGIACIGAATSCALTVAYTISHGFGWRWGQNLAPADAPQFVVTYTIALAVSVIPLVIGFDALKLTTFTMAITALVLPITIGPFLIIMNDAKYLGEHCNGRLSNLVVVFVTFVAFVLALVTIPLQLLGG